MRYRVDLLLRANVDDEALREILMRASTYAIAETVEANPSPIDTVSAPSTLQQRLNRTQGSEVRTSGESGLLMVAQE